MLFFDTNILVHAVDGAETVKRPVALGLLQRAIADKTLTLSAQVLQEFYSVAVRKRLVQEEDAAALLQLWAEHEVVATTAQLVLRAVELQRRLQISVWDALIVQAALEAGCETLYSEDLQHGMHIGELEIVNPFSAASAVHEPPAAHGASAPRPRARARR